MAWILPLASHKRRKQDLGHCPNPQPYHEALYVPVRLVVDGPVGGRLAASSKAARIARSDLRLVG